ncbi:phage tail tape measure protein [Pseudoneobacillus rhizosphaerae]|uniref:Chromosome partition protein Smc n=1 Tax=Pseudoneobacillus rhizosphaerae TaxID=2880968 RepID=A0A9C7L9G1_9BACI|nr:phage tail tape measure protein [Pseudoneobacillus rhizosphaerae]CAG9608056.1 Chromosome partition protein Smc [Pseudoneobacillus rhizosphaerae]
MTTNIGSLAVSLSLDASKFNGSMAQVDRNLRVMGSELKAIKALGSEYGKSLDGLKSKKDILSRTLETANIKLTETRKKYDELKASGTANEAQLERQAKKVNDAQAQFNHLKTELNDVEKALKIQSSTWTQLSQKLEPIGAKLKTVGDGMVTVGKDLSMKVTAPIVAMGTAAFKTAVDFESAFAGVRKTVDGTEAEFKALSSGIRNMAKEIPAAATEIAGVAEAAGQLGIKKEAILGFTRTMVDLGVSTNLTSDQAATALARLANITQMPQTEFDRLGSSIVALGNSMATTEAEIVEMSLRLAGQGKQIGLTEAQITALAGTMSSLGIEAEAGGTAMSTVLKKMQAAVMNGGKSLNAFSKAAGVDAKTFTKAWKDDPIKALDIFVKGLSASSKAGGNLSKTLADLAISGIREQDVLLRMSGASDILSKAVATSTKAWEDNNALTKEAEQRYKTTASQLKIMWNQVKDLGITIGNILIPIVMDLVDKITPIIQKFADMDTGTQKVILGIAGIAAAIGPVLVIGGTLVSSLGAIVTAVGTVSGAIAVVTTGAVAATPAVGALAGAFTILTGPIGLTIAAVAALTVAGIALYKHLSKDAIPEVERFGKETSKATKEALGSYFELSDSASQKLAELSINQQTITSEMKESLVGIYAEMNAKILAKMDERHEQQLDKLRQFFLKSNALTAEEEEKILADQEQRNKQEVYDQEQKEARIKEILEKATKEKRALTENERRVINTIQNSMNENAVNYLSKNEVESKAILERIKQSAGDLSARQAAEVVKNSSKQRDGAVKEAEKQYNESMAQIIRMRDETGVISAEQAERMIKEASKQRDEVVKRAKDMHKDVVKAAKEQAKDHVNEVDWETGEILSKWDAFIVDFKSKSLKQIGKDSVQGLIDGIAIMSNPLGAAIRKIAKIIPDEMKKSLDIHSPSKVTEKIGGQAGDGVIKGINNKQKAIAAAARKAAVTAAKNFKEAFDKANYNFKMGAIDSSEYIKSLEKVKSTYAKTPEQIRKVNLEIKKIQDMSVKEIEKMKLEAAKKEQEAVARSFEVSKNLIEKKSSLNQISLLNELKAWERVQGRYKDGTKEREEAEKNIMRVKKEINDKLISLNDEYVGKMTDINKKLIEDEKQLNDEYKKAVEDRTKSLYSFAGIFDEINRKSDVSGQQLLDNLKGQVSTFTEWSNNIRSLSKRGIDQGLLEELRDMGPRAADEIAALNGMTDAQLKEYAELWKTKNELARKQATAELDGMKKDTAIKIKELHKESISQLEQLRKEWEAKIKEIRTGTTNQFNPMVSTMHGIGENTIAGMIDGLSSMEGDLKKKAKQIADSVAASMRDALKIKSPSRIMMKIGGFVGEGLAIGMKETVSNVTKNARLLARAAIPAIPNINIPDFSNVNFAGVGNNSSGNPSNSFSFNIQPAPIIIDGVNVGTVDFDLVEDGLNSRFTSKMRVNGVRK